MPKGMLILVDDVDVFTIALAAVRMPTKCSQGSSE